MGSPTLAGTGSGLPVAAASAGSPAPQAGGVAPSPAGAAATSAGSGSVPSVAGRAAAAAGSGAAGGPAANGGSHSNALRVSITIPNVQPGVEGTQCVQVRLPNQQPVDVIKLHNTLTEGSHHFIVSALNDQAAPEKPLAPCNAFRGALAGAPLAITQKHDDIIELPAGIGYGLLAGHMMHLEMHYINTADSPLDITGVAELIPAAPGTALQQGGVLLVGSTEISIPPHMVHQHPNTYLPLPAGMDGVEFYAITGHTHRLGTSVRVSSVAGKDAPGTLLYAPENFDWEAPEMKHFSPTATVPSGGGFELQCAWNNITDQTVRFGESALAEMCFFWGYYYPRKPVVSFVLDKLDPELLKDL